MPRHLATFLVLFAAIGCNKNRYVTFEDEALERCVRQTVSLPEGDILAESLLGVTHLECQDAGITALVGIERLVDLEELSLFENDITDLSPFVTQTRRDGPVTNHPGLRVLQLGNNDIADLTPLAGLSELTWLGLRDNRVSDLRPLSGMSNLRWLDLADNDITDAAPLTALPGLAWVDLDHNDLADEHVLDGLDAEVYSVFGFPFDARTAPAEPVEDGRASSPVPTWSDAHRFVAEADAAGEVRFFVTDGLARYRVLPEYAGRILDEDGVYVLVRGERRTPIGTMGELPCSGAWAGACRASLGKKAPDATGVAPVYSLNLAVRDRRLFDDVVFGEAYTGLIDYALASPNQYDAGSCLYMSNTGAMELLVNQHLPLEQIVYGGDSDFSERYLMNADEYTPRSAKRYWLTDLVYTYNAFGGSMLDRDYPFVAGYVKETSSGGVAPSTRNDPNAYASLQYNWFDELPDDWRETLTPTPTADRTLIYMDPDEDQWDVALMTEDHLERIKYELRTKNAPVIVVYNHYLYWHAVVIVGYDDAVESDGCPMVESSMDYFQEQGFTSYKRSIERAIEDQGGCRTHGVFYVRDSIYDGTSDEPTYTYGGDYSFRDKYSDRVIEHSQDWVRFLGNHVYTVQRK